MVRKALLLKIFDAASMQRWNDQIRPVELTELDKQAHKMIIAYVLGRCEEDAGNEKLDWVQIVEGGIFEFLQRTVLTDIKPPLFHRIKENRKKYEDLNEWVYKKLYPVISPLGEGFCLRFKSYLLDTERNVNRRIISAAHFYATKWEFNIIERANPQGYAIEEIKNDLLAKQEKYGDLSSMQRLLKDDALGEFVDVCGQLRFQLRWGHVWRVPKTSVLGHMLIIAIVSYLFSLQKQAACSRAINNYFTGLFHDLPEVLTRDIINPVKKSVEGIDELIKDYEKEEMETKIYKLLPNGWHAQMRSFTENEYSDKVTPGGGVERDGKLVKAVDDLSAFIEVYLALKNGIENEIFLHSKYSLAEKYKSQVISGIDIGQIYADFE
ncbi:MAG: HD domain-containing protein [Candidatus Omnitrophica bacterium]|nr:HD domain-containing protein [Candidatus Omnitrophota bacterium]